MSEMVPTRDFRRFARWGGCQGGALTPSTRVGNLLPATVPGRKLLEDTTARTLRSVALALLGALALGVPELAMAEPAGTAGGAGATAQVGFERRPQLSTQDELAQADM